MKMSNRFVKLKENAVLPTRATKNSAGYDFSIPEEPGRVYLIRPGETLKIKTGIAVKLDSNKYLAILVRSSIGIKKHLELANGTAIIDADFYGNPDNGGEITLALYNYGEKAAELKAGERIAQGVICQYFKAAGDKADADRSGGIGSTGK